MGFEFDTFSSNALASVNTIRSQNSNLSNLEGNPQKATESRINAFYRALGLPAVIINTEISSHLDKFNNGNLHDISLSQSENFDLVNREEVFSADIPDKIVDRFLDGENNLLLGDGIRVLGSGLKKQPKRTRGNLFPMFVNGNIGVYPQDRRVGGAFNSDPALTIGDVKYKRPTIELIILLRLRNDGVQDSSIQNKLNEDFLSSLVDNFSGNAEAVEEFANAFKDIQNLNLNLVTSEILEELLNATLGIRTTVTKTVSQLGRIRSEIRTIYEDKKENIPDEQPKAKSTDNTGSAEKANDQIELERAKRSAILSLLEFDDTLISDSVFSNRNLKEAWMGSEILSVLNPPPSKSDKEAVAAKKKKQKVEKLNRAQQRIMDIMLGTFSGLSGVDILVVITSLFVIKEEYLLGLLNNESFDRLRKIKGEGFNPARSDVKTSVAQLQQTVERLYFELESVVDIVDIVDSNISGE